MRSYAYGLLIVMGGAVVCACGGGSGDDDESSTSPTPDGSTPGATDSPAVTGTPETTDTPDETTATPATTPAVTPTEPPSPTPGGSYTIAAGNVSGTWCGVYSITGNIVVASGATLHICAGSTLLFNSQTGLRVDGSLEIDGSSSSHIAIKAAQEGSIWSGMTVSGKLDARFFDLHDAVVGVSGLSGSTINLSDASLKKCQSTLQLANGGAVTNSNIAGGQSVMVSGGMFNLSNSTVDLLHPGQSPDCINFNAGGANLDHVHVTGCHCALHINAAPLGIQISHSALDGAAYPMMVAKTSMVVSGSNLTGTDSNILDIGGSIHAVVSGNYWGGGAPVISTSQPSQFVGTDVYSTTPFADAGVQ